MHSKTISVHSLGDPGFVDRVTFINRNIIASEFHQGKNNDLVISVSILIINLLKYI